MRASQSSKCRRIAIHFKKYVRDLKENPFDLMRMLARKMPRTPKSAMGGGLNLNPFGTPTPTALR